MSCRRCGKSFQHTGEGIGGLCDECRGKNNTMPRAINYNEIHPNGGRFECPRCGTRFVINEEERVAESRHEPDKWFIGDRVIWVGPFGNLMSEMRSIGDERNK